MTNVEADTIGDWAGHTPEVDVDETYTFSLSQRGNREVDVRPLGLKPYVLITPEFGDDGDLNIHVEAGGGAELEGLDGMLRGIGSLLGQPEAVQQIHDAIESAKAAEAAAAGDEYTGE